MNSKIVHAASGSAWWVKHALGQTREQASQPMQSMGLRAKGIITVVIVFVIIVQIDVIDGPLHDSRTSRG